MCQYYSGNIRNAYPRGTIKIMELLRNIQNPPANMRSLIDTIRLIQDKGLRDHMKTKVPAFTPCALVENGPRRYTNITRFTQVMACDYDGVGTPSDSAEFRDAMYNKYSCIIGAWTSSSGRGVRMLVRIPEVSSVDEFKRRFKAFEDEIGGLYKGWDSAPKNCILPMFYSYDTDARIRYSPDVYDAISDSDELLDSQRKKVFFKTPPKPQMANKFAEWSLNAATRAIGRITDNGHPQLRAASFALGGYVGAGYLTEAQAIEHMDMLIDSNSYLNRKPAVYKKTARQMIAKGTNEPLYYSK